MADRKDILHCSTDPCNILPCENKKQRTSRNSSSHPVDNNPEEPIWSQLPATVVVQIFLLLDILDRISMRQVCKSWLICSYEPRLWRKGLFRFVDLREEPDRKTYFSTRNTSSVVVHGGKRAIKFAHNYSSFLHDVTIHLQKNTKTYATEFSAFAQLLEVAKLKTLRVIFFSSWRNTPNVDLVTPLIRIIINQPSLEEFSIKHPLLDAGKCFNVLQSVTRTCGDRLKSLHVCRLFEAKAHLNNKDQVITEIKKLTKLVKIEIDNAFLRKDVFSFWTEQCPSLAFIKIWFTPQGYAPSSEVWKALVAKHPELQASILAFENTDVELDFNILSPAIPLVELIWCTDACYSNKTKLRQFLDHLVKYKKSLRSLNVTFAAHLGDPDHDAVMDALSKFSKLPPCKFEKYSLLLNQWRISEKDDTYLEYSSSSSSSSSSSLSVC